MAPKTWTEEADRSLMLTALKMSNLGNMEVAKEYVNNSGEDISVAAVGKRLERLKKMDAEGVTATDSTPKAKPAKSTTPRASGKKAKSTATTPSTNGKKRKKHAPNSDNDDDELPDYESDADGPVPTAFKHPIRETPKRAKKIQKVYKESSASAEENDDEELYTTKPAVAAVATDATDSPMNNQGDQVTADNKENSVHVNGNGIEETDASTTVVADA